MAQAAEHLPSKCEVLQSNPGPTNRKNPKTILNFMNLVGIFITIPADQFEEK
jgi:hypothetical protein